MYYDDQGNSRNDDGTVASYGLHQGTQGEQICAGVSHWDTPASAQCKVWNYRESWGLDPYTGVPKPPPPPPVFYGGYSPPSGYSDSARPGSSGSALGFLGSLFLVVLLFMAAAIGLVAWQGGVAEREAWAAKAEAWALGRAVASEEFAPISAYAAYGPKGSPPALSAKESDPGALAKKAKALLSGKKGKRRVSDKDLSKWGFAAWACLSRNPGCLGAAEAAGNDPERLRALGLLFLDYASRKGSPDADADFGLYVVQQGGPMGKDPYLALDRWRKGAENPNASRSRDLLEMLKSDSPWAMAGRYASAILRSNF